jgi:selenocysteine lyase/cysteine desulfurase
MQDLNFVTPAFERALADVPPGPTVGAEFDESYWEAIRRLYATTPSVVNLENGYWGAMAEPVKDVYRHWTDRINAENTAFIRPHWPGALDSLRTIVAGALRCDAGEIALTRGATEAMLALIGGYNGLRVGDKVLCCDLDYPAMRHAMAWLRERRGVVPIEFSIPEPATREGVLAAYECMFRDYPGIRLVLLTHLSHCTGLVMPVRELVAMARSFGAEVIVDAAHSWGQLDFDVGDLGANFVAFNLHKWIGAPLGCGAMYIRKGCAGAIDSYMGDRDFPADDVRSKIHTGSPNFAAWLTIPSALALHRRIGAKAKEVRLRRLRDE